MLQRPREVRDLVGTVTRAFENPVNESKERGLRGVRQLFEGPFLFPATEERLLVNGELIAGEVIGSESRDSSPDPFGARLPSDREARKSSPPKRYRIRLPPRAIRARAACAGLWPRPRKASDSASSDWTPRLSTEIPASRKPASELSLDVLGIGLEEHPAIRSKPSPASERFHGAAKRRSGKEARRSATEVERIEARRGGPSE